MKRRNFIAALFAPLIPIKKEETKIDLTKYRSGCQKLTEFEVRSLDAFWRLQLQQNRSRLSSIRSELSSKGTI